MRSGMMDCMSCRYLKKLLDADCPTLVPDALGCELHAVILPLYQKRSSVLCRDGRDLRSGQTVKSWWPGGYARMKPDVLYTFPNDYDPTLTELCAIDTLKKLSCEPALSHP